MCRRARIWKTTPFDVLIEQAGRLPGLLQPDDLHDADARYSGPLCLRIRLHRQHGPVRSVPDATHAWVQVYLPVHRLEGLRPDQRHSCRRLSHVRSAVGRHYRETAPISGTLYTAAVESLSVDVEVTILDPPLAGEVAPLPDATTDKLEPVHVSVPVGFVRHVARRFRFFHRRPLAARTRSSAARSDRNAGRSRTRQATSNVSQVWLDGDVLACGLPRLRRADGDSLVARLGRVPHVRREVELTEEQEREAQRLLESRAVPRRRIRPPLLREDAAGPSTVRRCRSRRACRSSLRRNHRDAGRRGPAASQAGRTACSREPGAAAACGDSGDRAAAGAALFDTGRFGPRLRRSSSRRGRRDSFHARCWNRLSVASSACVVHFLVIIALGLWFFDKPRGQSFVLAGRFPDGSRPTTSNRPRR